MSLRERDRLKVIGLLNEGRLRQKEVARLLRLSVRQVRRIQRRYAASGDAGLVNRSRGRRSNNRISDDVRQRALACLRRDYADFGPTLASEKLLERDGIAASRETVRQWMMAEGLWQGRPRRPKHRQWRERRKCFGEMVQLDASPHAWLEGRGAGEPVLITFIDDATGLKLQRFYESDGTMPTLDLLGRWLRKYGRMLSIYSDRAGHYVINRRPSEAETRHGRQAETQVGRALRELEIDYIAANSPQAKGRVERSHGVDQDRLIKELRLRNISTIEEANRFLEEVYTPQCNRRFAVRPASSVDAHRRLKGFDLAAILSHQKSCTVANDYTVQYEGRKWQIERQSIGSGLRRGKVLVERRLDGTVKLRWQGRYLKCRQLPMAPVSAEVAEQAPASTPARRSATTSGLPEGPPPAATRRQPWTPPADHPWKKLYKKRTVLLCGKADISTLR